jgi:hypothetical protein
LPIAPFKIDSTMSSETSTESRRRDADGVDPRHVFLLLAMLGATAAVMVVGRGHPVALIILSLTIVAAGFVGLAMQGALSGFLGLGKADSNVRTVRATDALEREKALVLRAIKELEFDRAMGKVSDADFTQLSASLRARALSLMQEIERGGSTPEPSGTAAPAARACARCETVNDADARFCKSCGEKL